MMRRAATALAVCALLGTTPAQAQTSPLVEMLTPSPLSVGILLAKWVFREEKKMLYVEVVAEGVTLQEAREQAFRMAVERTVGTIVASETEVQDSRIARDEIITYASGFVNDYRLVKQISVASGVQVRMQVWVSHNNLRDRLLSRSSGDARIEGGRIAEQIRSFQHERSSGDRLLETVLRDFPQRAFDVQVHRTEVRVDDRRRTFLQIPITLSWSADYVRSLTEAVKAINQRPECDSMWRVCNPRPVSMIQVPGVRAFFDDSVAHDLMHKHMIIERPQVLVQIRDTANRVQYRGCYSVKELDHSDWSNRYFVGLGGYIATINSALVERFTVSVPLENVRVDGLDRVDVSLVRVRSC